MNGIIFFSLLATLILGVVLIFFDKPLQIPQNLNFVTNITPKSYLTVYEACEQHHTKIGLHFYFMRCIVSITNYERKQLMPILTIGQEFVTLKSGVKGTIREIVQNSSGSVRVRLDVKGKERWTTIAPEFKVLSVSS